MHSCNICNQMCMCTQMHMNIQTHILINTYKHPACSQIAYGVQPDSLRQIWKSQRMPNQTLFLFYLCVVTAINALCLDCLTAFSLLVATDTQGSQMEVAGVGATT